MPIRDLLPVQVAVEEHHVDLQVPQAAPDDPGPLFAAEARATVGAVPVRRAEFRAGRLFARAAMRQLGLPPAPILVGINRDPVWPEGVIGSISHCQGYVAAAVARVQDVRGVGIDVELAGPLPSGVLGLVSRVEERRFLARKPTIAGTDAERVLFSAKESIFKLWFPLRQRWLDFDDVVVSLRQTDTQGGRFAVEACSPALGQDGSVLLTEMVGRWGTDGVRVYTAATLPLLAVDRSDPRGSLR